MSRWENHYKNKLNDKYKKYINKKYALFIVEIANYVIKNNINSMVELGCGIGSISLAVQQLCKGGIEHVELFDNDIAMLSLAYKNLIKVPLEYSSYHFTLWDIENPYPFRKFDLVHSHGVLEHFSDETIYNITNHWRDIPQFHYIPGNKYTTKTMGDERLLPKEYWKELTGMRVMTFNNGYDYILSNRL